MSPRKARRKRDSERVSEAKADRRAIGESGARAKAAEERERKGVARGSTKGSPATAVCVHPGRKEARLCRKGVPFRGETRHAGAGLRESERVPRCGEGSGTRERAGCRGAFSWAGNRSVLVGKRERMGGMTVGWSAAREPPSWHAYLRWSEGGVGEIAKVTGPAGLDAGRAVVLARGADCLGRILL